jgi:hypothetical protein
MRRFTLLGLALMAVFALLAAVSSSAFALELPENLPASTTRTWTGASEGKPEFKMEGVTPIICEEATTAEGTETTSKPPLGLFHIHVVGCHAEISKGTVVKCTDLNHLTAGGILVLGTWHLVWDRKAGGSFTELTTAVLFLVEPVHFSCSSLILIVVQGEQLCLHLVPTESKVTHSFHCIAEETIAGKPHQTEEWCKKDVGGVCTEPVAPKLEAFINHPKAAVVSAEQALGNTTYKEAISADV